MRYAIALARRGNPFPSPRVGVVMAKKDRVMAAGFKQQAMEPHVEMKVLLAALKGRIVPAEYRALFEEMAELTRLGKIFPQVRQQYLSQLDAAKGTLLDLLSFVDGEDGYFRPTTIFSTLEPCSDRVGYISCAALIAAAGIRQAVIGTIDNMDLRVNGSGIRQLCESGVKVKLAPNDLARSIREGNTEYFQRRFVKENS
jgi:pyrimidine deaminase RibD-like protein